MIKGLFCHYLPIYKDINGVYCSTTLTDDFFSRYFCVVDRLVVADRVYHIKKTYKEAHQEPITLKNLQIEEFSNLSTLKGMARDYSVARKRIKKLVDDSNLIFVRGGFIGILGAEEARKQKKPYLAECAGCSWDEYWNYSLSGKILAPYMELMARKITKNASHVIYVTEKWLQERYPTNGVDTYASNVILDQIDENALMSRISKIKGYGKKKSFVIGTTGGVGNKAKGQQFVMQAMKMLEDKYDLYYELVGGGDDTYLRCVAQKCGVSDRVVFKGQLMHTEVLRWLDSIDIYIQPSMQEGLPRSLIEAMSRGCPALGSTTGGIPELLDERAIFQRGQVNSLIKTLEAMLETDLSETAKRNFNKAKEYQIDLINERRNKLYIQYKEQVYREGEV